ncbi:MAG: Gfo/Idh/MocA family oxidoreductase [Bacillota bacterium]
MDFLNKRICVVGGGQWGEIHIRTLHGMGCLRGIVECRESRLAELVGRFGGVKGHACIEDSLGEQYDGYILATPTGTHFELGAALLREGKNVLIEKPFTLTSEHSQILVELARTHGCRLMVGHQLVFHPAIMKMHQLIEEGVIGKALYAYSTRLSFGIVHEQENVLWSFASHDIAVFNYLLGRMPCDIVADGGCFLKQGVDDMAAFTLTYHQSVKVHVFVSWLHPFKQHRLIIVGEEGMLAFEDSASDFNIYFHRKKIRWEEDRLLVRDEGAMPIRYDMGAPLRKELEHFVGNLDSEITVCDGQSGHDTICLLEKISEKIVYRKTEVVRKGGTTFFAHESVFIEREVVIGTNTKIWHFSRVQKGARIGSGCTIGQNVFIDANVRIGNSVRIENSVSLYAGVELEDHVFCGPGVVFANEKTPRCRHPRDAEGFGKTVVRIGATIGANATIICGNTIGRFAFVAAGAVVTTDVLDHELVMGVPARHAGWVCECGGRLSGSLICGRCGKCYHETHEGLCEYS